MSEQPDPKPMTVAEALAEVVRLELFQARIAQRVVAARLALSPGQVSQRLSGRTPFRLDEVAEVADLLGLETSGLVQLAEDYMAARNESGPRSTSIEGRRPVVRHQGLEPRTR